MTQITMNHCGVCSHGDHDGRVCNYPVGPLGKVGVLCPCGVEKASGPLDYEAIPRVFKAVQVIEGNDDLILSFMRETDCPFESVGDHELLIHLSPKVDLKVYPGNWIVRWEEREFAVYTPAQFHLHFRPATVAQ